MARRRKKSTKRTIRRGIKKGTSKPKPMKIAALIASAIQDLRETKGLTPKKIIGYISYTHSIPEGRVKRQVKSALKRGVEYGILRRYRGHYFLPTNDELQRANRMAVRFARLPTPSPSGARTSSNSARRKPRGLGRASRRTSLLRGKRLQTVHSLPLSIASSIEKIVADDLSIGSGL